MRADHRAGTAFVDSPLLVIDDDLQIEARTVLSHTAEPQNAFEVAVILETLGYTDAMAASLGSSDLFALSEDVYETLGDFTTPGESGPPSPERGPGPAATARFLGLGLLYSIPWLTAIVVLLSTGTAFWSAAAFNVRMASGATLALFVGLVTSGGFVQAFARRATFYLLQERLALFRWTALWFLGAGAAVSAGVIFGCYLFLERVVAAYTPGTTRTFLELGLAVAVLQLAFAPLYTLRAFGWLLVSVVAGAAALLAGLAVAGGGVLVSPFAVVKVQLIAVASMTVVALAATVWLLRRPKKEPRDPHPSRWPVARSAGPYALYGSSYFCLIVVDQMVAGGLWSGRFAYDRAYEVTVGVALMLVLPLFAYVVAVSERFPLVVLDQLGRLSVAEVGAFRSRMAAFYRRSLAVLVLLGAGLAAALVGVVALAGPHLSLAGVLDAHRWLFVGALAAYLALSAGMLNAQLLFALARPAAPALAATVGAVVSASVGGTVGLLWATQAGALIGLLSATLTFAGITSFAAWRAFSRFDVSYYRAF